MVADLWADDLEAGKPGSSIEALQSLAQTGTEPDRVAAAVAAARWFAAQGHSQQAGEEAARAAGSGQLIFGFLDPSLPLTVGMLLREAGRDDQAQAVFQAARRHFPRHSDIGIATALASDPVGRMRAEFRRRGLALPTAPEGPGPAFDRLHCRPPAAKRGPLVTVLMPARNAEATILTALRSLLNQSWRDLEILVIDDGSVDETTQRVADLATDDARIRLLQGNGMGAYAARNIGLQEAKGEFVTGLDSDDWAHPARIAQQIAPLLQDKALKATTSDWYRADSDLRPRLFWRQDRIIHPNLSSLMIRRSLKDDIGYWDEVLAGADSEFHDRIVARFGAGAIRSVLGGVPLSIGRVRAGSLTQARATSISSQQFGPRADYARAYALWHRSGGLYLGRTPQTRPFPAPPELAPNAAHSRPESTAESLQSLPARPLPNPRRKVLFFAHRSGPELYGAERSLVDMLAAGRRVGVAIDLVLPETPPEPYRAALSAAAAKIVVQPLRQRRGGSPPTEDEIARLADLIRASAPDEVHVNTCTLQAPLIAARKVGLPAVMHLRELPASDPILCRDLAVTPAMLRAAILEEADRIIANSTATADWIGAERALVAPNRVDPALLDLPFGPGERLRVGLIGSSTPRKGLFDLIRIAQALGAQPGLEFLVIGPSPAHPLPPNLRAIGYLAAPLEAIAACDVVLSLSHFAESFGRTVLETMAGGRPVVAYDHGHPARLLSEGGGILVPPFNWKAAAAALDRLSRDQARLQALSSRGRTAAQALNGEWPDGLAGSIFGLTAES